MTWRKRLFDLFFATLLSVILGPVLLALLIWLLVKEGRPVFYLAERMTTPTRGFRLWKLRTMTLAETDTGVSGGDKAARITRTGAWLRARRLDEFPQRRPLGRDSPCAIRSVQGHNRIRRNQWSHCRRCRNS